MQQLTLTSFLHLISSIIHHQQYIHGHNRLQGHEYNQYYDHIIFNINGIMLMVMLIFIGRNPHHDPHYDQSHHENGHPQ